MNSERLRIAGAIGVLALLIALGFFAIRAGGPSGSRTPKKPKLFMKGLAEGISVQREGLYGIDFVKCASCHLEKIKSGPLTFGGLNELVLEDLRVVIPGEEARGKVATADPSGEQTPGALSEEFHIEAFKFLIAQGEKRGIRFSSVRIEGLEVSLLDGAETIPMFVASRARPGKDILKLEGCRLFGPDGGANPIHNAYLTFKPALVLNWEEGEDKRSLAF